MSDETKKERPTFEEQQRLTAFFSLLIQIDTRERITATSQKKYKERMAVHEV